MENTVDASTTVKVGFLNFCVTSNLERHGSKILE